MKKIVITSFVMPHELDDLERVLVDLNKASKFIDGNNYEFYISFSVDDYLFDWENSKVDKQFFIDRFNSLKPLTDWAGKSTYQIRDTILGAFSTKIHAHRECIDATHFIWLDTDICFDEKILYYMESAVDAIKSENITTKYFITPEIVKYWDTTWDCLVNERFINKPIGYQSTNNPHVDAIIYDEPTLEEVRNNVPGQPYMKFGGGWFALISKELMKVIPFPENYGHYGLDDTYLMWGAELLKDHMIKQFKLKNIVVCENYFDRTTTYKGKIQFIDKREEFKKYNEQMFHIGLENLLKNK
jgi:hypothetical protein